MKALVLYYSRTGNTKRIAEAVAETLKADLEPLVDPSSYDGAVGFVKGGRDAMTGRVAEIAPLKHDPAQYDLVVIGQPVWAARPVPAVNGLARAHDLKGRKLALFVTFDGAGDKGCLERTAALFPDVTGAARISFLKVGKNRDAAAARAAAWATQLANG
jgi:flavodoxin